MSHPERRRPSLVEPIHMVIPRILLVISIVFALSIPLVFPHQMKTVFANGAAHAVVKNAKVGPYELRVGILPGSPKVGNLHLSILVKNAETGATINRATVMVMATGPTGATDVSPMQATNTPQSPQFYDVNIPLDTVGSWVLTVDTDSSLGKASLDLSLEVTESGGLNVVWILAGVVAILAVTFWAWGRIHSRRSRNS